eukprot:Sspe_Gene.12672::Locus_4331_Transcript_1_1_Confidence_1.000_Length_1820::g.12672::m.12672
MEASPPNVLSSRSDGVSCITAGDRLVVYGGPYGDLVWSLNLTELSWEAVKCRGDVPAPRRHHSAVVYEGSMVVYGGEVIPSGTTGNAVDSRCPIYALDLETFSWCTVRSLNGPGPGQRSHHTAVVHKHTMVVMGGKRDFLYPPSRRAVGQAKAGGFYDVFVFYFKEGIWERLSTHPAPAPMLWGHSAGLFRHYMVVFGGFDVSSCADEGGPDGPPDAQMSDMVHSLDLNKAEWSRSTPRGVAPCPRALHCGVVHGIELIVFGGLTLQGSLGTAVPANDAWRWDIGSGVWSPFPFCLDRWKSARLLHAVHRGTLVVANTMTQCHIVDLRKAIRSWRTVECSTDGLRGPPRVVETTSPQPPTPFTSPPRHQASDDRPRWVRQAPDVLQSPRNYDEEVNAQRDRIRNELRQRLQKELDDADRQQRSEQIVMLQRQVENLQSQLSELTQLQRIQSMAAAAPNQLADEVHRLSDILHTLKTTPDKKPPPAPPPHTWSPAPVILPFPSPVPPPVAVPYAFPVASVPSDPPRPPPEPERVRNYAVQRMQHIHRLQENLKEIEAGIASDFGGY